MNNILHLNSYFIDNNLYANIYTKLDNKYKQKIFVPIKKDRVFNRSLSLKNGELLSKTIIERFFHTLFYKHKIKTIYKSLVRNKYHKNIDIVHAHNLFVDGAVALELKKKHRLKYIVAIRMTDVDLQYKLMIHRRKIANEILENASQIIFISPIYKERLFSMMKKDIIDRIINKCITIPNGIDDFWLATKTPTTSFSTSDTYRILYLGQIQKRKNILKLIDAVNLINTQNIPVTLTVAGNLHPNEKKYGELFLNKVKSSCNIDYKGHISDRKELLQLFSKMHLMALPAKRELFGLVYIEAISQNTPVLYCENEGISPFLANKPFAFSISSNSLSVEGIANAIKYSISKYDELLDFSNYALDFSWDSIIKEYELIYNNV